MVSESRAGNRENEDDLDDLSSFLSRKSSVALPSESFGLPQGQTAHEFTRHRPIHKVPFDRVERSLHSSAVRDYVDRNIVQVDKVDGMGEKARRKSTSEKLRYTDRYSKDIAQLQHRRG